MRTADALERGRVAARALEALDGDLADRQIFAVECQRGHQLATVYATSVGSVFVSRGEPGPHIPGQPEEHGLATPGSGEAGFVDLLWADTHLGDELTATCGCGPQVLSRRELIGHLDLGERFVRVA